MPLSAPTPKTQVNSTALGSPERTVTPSSKGELSNMTLDSPAAEPSTSPDTPATTSEARSPLDLHAGDRVTIARPSVNGRAWMSTLAPVSTLLEGGTQGILLSEPVRSEGRRWVKFRPLDSQTHFYVAARYCELVEPGPRAPADDRIASEGLPELWSPIQAGDLVTAQPDVDVRPVPAYTGASPLRVRENALLTVLEGPRVVDGTDWLRVEHASGMGWVELEWMIPFVRGGKWIEVDTATQTLIAREDGKEVSRALISSGKPGFPTPAGAFAITHKFPIRHMKSSVRGEHWDFPAVPWAMRFRAGGFYLHSCYWSDEFGSAQSHGCVNMPVPYAEWLYEWTPVGTPLWIHR
jgi:hypothetical protein